LQKKATDAELVAATLAGRQAAFAELVRRYQRPVYTVVVRMARERELAEDICQEAFVRAYRFLDRYDSRYRFSSWIFRIAHNVTVDHFRRKRVTTVSLDLPNDTGATMGDFLVDAAAPTPSKATETANLGGALEAALARLRPCYREVVLLRFQQDLSYPEIVAATGLPLGTVKTYLHRARKEMAGYMRVAGWGPKEAS
jgi:RNA polymerase sigma-70 factor (ECF subfamily)